MYKCILICVFLSYTRAEPVSVVTGVGTIIGQREDGYDTFLGIPYAKVDESNPFGNSIAYPYFKTPFNANDSSTICPQVVFQVSGTLQCLHLHIYVPHRVKSDKKVPILVWFHGGGFAFGSGGEYGGQHLVKQDIIVITVNYRLGPYGFLCLDDPTVPGNQGIKDQIDALRWVKKYIDAFGGDPRKVTIAGESYGGAAVDLHLYSEYETLFDKAIVQSGSVFFKGFYVRPDYQAAVKMAKYLGHDVTSTKDAISALAKDDPRSVTSAARNLSLPMSVCNEKRFNGVQNFVNSDPFHLDNLDRIKNTKIMVGYTSMEYLRFYANQPKEFWDKFGDIFVKTLQSHFAFSKNEYAVLGDILKKFYLGEKAIGPESLLELSEFASDFIINHSIERSIDKYLLADAEATVYKYLFSYIGGSPFKDIAGSGASHTEELKYLFEWETPVVKERNPVAGAKQMMIRNRMTTLWANFVKYGNPTPEKTKDLPITWTPVKGATRPYLNIDADLSMRDQAYHRRIAFWDMMWQNYERDSVVYVNPRLMVGGKTQLLGRQARTPVIETTTTAIYRATIAPMNDVTGTAHLDTYSMYLILNSAIFVYLFYSSMI